MSLPVAIGIDFGGTSIKPAIVRGAEILEYGRALDTQALQTPEKITQAMAEEITRLHQSYPEASGVGIGMPGMIDAVNGIVRGLSNVEGWNDVPLRAMLVEQTGLPIALENDAKAMAYGEWRYGAANQWLNVICITMGTGVGGGLILNGRLYRGAANASGEIGQTSINIHSDISGVYGNKGALEKFVGNREITERAILRYREATGEERTAETCSPRHLSEAANAGDPIAKALWEEIGTEVGAALVNAVWLLNPECIVIGGGVAKAGDLVFNPIREAIRQRTMRVYHENLVIIPAALGSDAGVIGAAALGADAAGPQG